MKNFILTFFCLSFAFTAMAQTVVTGNVVDNKGETVIGATVLEEGTTNGTITDFDGNFSLTVSSPNATLNISSFSYQTQNVALNGRTTIKVTLSEETLLQEVVAIGYGTMTKEKLTGSVASINQADFNRGLNTSSMSLIAGKVAGVNITPSSGRAGDGATIRIRGGASLNASNDPLIVIDGLPLGNDRIDGQANALASLNPNDIESMTILKDASATAIYGSRASNGVIIITTKKGAKGEGNKKVRLEFSSTNSIATIARRVNVLSGDELKKLVEDYTFYKSDGVTPDLVTKARYLGYLGYTEGSEKKYANTDWQKEIFRPAFSTDNTFSVSGIAPHLPYRVAVGYLNQDGILKTDNVQRVTGAITLNPSFFKGDLLSFNINLKGSWQKSRFGDDGAIGAALRMDPTKPVTTTDPAYDKFNHYWQWIKSDGSWNSMATSNPVAILNSKNDIGTVTRAFGNIQMDYKMHFCKDLRANVNVGFDYSNGKGYNEQLPWKANLLTQGGQYNKYNQTNFNFLFEAYLAYSKDWGKHHFDIMGGYTYQSWLIKGPRYPDYYFDRETVIAGSEPEFPSYKTERVLISFYGRVNYGFADKYLIQASVRTDASSRFAPSTRWGIFPAASAAWIISKENFLKNNKAVSNLKLRFGWGITGQQDGIPEYQYLAYYSMSKNTAMVQFGDEFYNMWRPEKYDPYRKWEETMAYNVGIDYGFLNGKIYGAIDLYYKHTYDLLNEVFLPGASNFGNKMVKNIGTVDNKGIEFSFNYIPLDNKDWTVDIGLNFTMYDTKITKLTLNDKDTTYIGAPVGGVSGGTGTNVQIHTVGYTPHTFYLYQQEYDADGKPIAVSADYAEHNRVRSKSPQPIAFLGLNANVRWKQLTLSTSLRSNIGNYMYNNINSNGANYSQILNPNNYIQNSTRDIYNTGFYSQQLLSNHYLENASFLKMDYISLAYDFGKLVKPVSLLLNFTVQNVFVVTKYTGIDPEISGGIDNNRYPYPRTFSLGLKLTF